MKSAVIIFVVIAMFGKCILINADLYMYNTYISLGIVYSKTSELRNGKYNANLVCFLQLLAC